MSWLNAIVVGIILSFPYALATWFSWQEIKAKTGTLIPSGEFTGRHGIRIAIITKSVCFLLVFLLCFIFYWWTFAVWFVMVFLGGHLAKYLERAMYAHNRLDSFEHHARRILERCGEDKALSMWAIVVPRWWTNLMSWRWEKEYKRQIGPILKSKDVSDPLFDDERFKIK